MGGSNSREKKKRKQEKIQARTHDTLSISYATNTYENVEANIHLGGLNSNTNPTYRSNPVDYESGSSKEINSFPSVENTLNTSITLPCQTLSASLSENHVGYKDLSNLNDFTNESRYDESSGIPKIPNLTKQNYSIDMQISSFNEKSLPTGIEISNTQIQLQTVGENGTENTQSTVGRVGGVKRNSWEVDEEQTEGEKSEQLTGQKNLQSLFDFPGNPRIKRKALNNERELDSVEYENYNSMGTSNSLNFHSEMLSDSHYADDIDAIELFCQAKNTDNVNDLNLSFDVLDILSFPSEWSSCTLDSIGLVDVTPDSIEGRSLLRFFHRSSVSLSFKLQITNVARIENPFLHSFYMLKKEEMESRNGHVDELYLYHGTKQENVKKICLDNLNWRLYTDKHRFGCGVSFSPSATYSSHYSDSCNEKVMFLFKVLVSHADYGTEDTIIPPIQDSIAFDTSIKDDTSVVVKYSDNEFYPLYKITYTRHNV